MSRGITHDELQRLVPAALEQDLLDEVLREAGRREVLDLLRAAAYPDEDISGVWECAACLRRNVSLAYDGECAPDAGGCRTSSVEENASESLTEGQAVGLVQHLLGAQFVIAERMETGEDAGATRDGTK